MTKHTDDGIGRALTRRALLIATVAAPLWLRSSTRATPPAGATAANRESLDDAEEAPEMGPGSMTDEERRDAVSLLETSAGRLRAAVADLTATQWHFRPSPSQWTPADIVEHLARSEHAVLQLVTKVLVTQPVTDPGRRSKTDDAAVLALVRDRGHRYQAIAPVRPQGSAVAGPELVVRFEALRADSLAYLKTTHDDLRGRLADHPVAGEIDAYQWFLFLGAHTDRHLAQLREVTADPAFPSGD